MRIRSIVLAVGLAMGAGFSPVMVSAEPPTPVVINAHPCAFAPVEIGTWEATGAIDDSGTFVKTGGASSPPNRPPFSTGPIREEFLFMSSQGTFTIKAEENITETGLTGVWQLKAGTGAFASASGHGEPAFSFDPDQANSCEPPLNHFTYALTGIASTA